MSKRQYREIPIGFLSKEELQNGTIRNGECVEWIYPRNSEGYGIVTRNKNSFMAHRVSWTVYFGKIPDGMIICHKCDNPSCVNPDHLFLGTSLTNILDMLAKKRGARYKSKIDEATIIEVLLLLEKKLTKLSIKQRLKISFKAIDSIQRDFSLSVSETVVPVRNELP